MSDLIVERKCINVWSDMNTWIDFCILVSEPDFEAARAIIEKAYNEWWELPDAQFEPLADYMSICLKECGIEYEIYFKEDEEEEEEF